MGYLTRELAPIANKLESSVMRGGRPAEHAPALVKFVRALELVLNSLVSVIKITFLASLKEEYQSPQSLEFFPDRSKILKATRALIPSKDTDLSSQW